MNKRYSISEARDNLAAIVHDLELTDNIELTRRGQPIAVLLSKEKYDRMQTNTTGFWRAYENFTKQIKLTELNIEPSEIFGGLRDPA